MQMIVSTQRFTELIRVLCDLEKLQRELVDVIQSKIEAMRSADRDAMRTTATAERDVLDRIEERNGFRRRLMDIIGEQLGLPPMAGRTLRASQLAGRLEPEQRDTFNQTIDQCKEAVASVARVNRVAANVSRSILDHFKTVFDAVASCGASPAGYAGGGHSVAEQRSQIFETVG